MKLVHSISELGSREINPIVQTNGETAIPILASVLLWDDDRSDESTSDQCRIEATRILRNIFARGAKTHKTMIINAGIVSKLSRMFLWRHNSKIDREALLSLDAVLYDEITEHVEQMIEEGVTPRIVQLLCSVDLDVIDASLRLLVIISKDHFDIVLKSTVHEHLFRIITMPFLDNQKNILSNCSVLLRKMIEVDASFVPTLQVAYPEVIPRLVELVKLNIDDVNLAVFFIQIAKEAPEHIIDSLVNEADFLSTLVRFQDSPVEAISESAITCLRHISDTKSCHFVESGESLAWGEYHTLELVDSDEESCVSYEEVIEVSDDDLMQEEELAQAILPWFGVGKEHSPTLLGMPLKVMETILTYNDADVNLLKDVCKRFCDITSSATLRLIRRFQKRTDNEITSVLCGNIGEDNVPSCNDILQSLMQSFADKLNSTGQPACFRLRGDTVEYLFGEHKY